MSRSDNRRRNRERDWNNRDYSERTERNGRSLRSDRNTYESRERSGYRNEKKSRTERERTEFDERRSLERRRYGSDKRPGFKRQFSNPVTQAEIKEQENAIKHFKENIPTCSICGQPINDIANAISNKDDETPVHFDCVFNKISETEKLGLNEKIAYIGQGRFGIIYYENLRDVKHFSIRKIIEWEKRDKERSSWRNEMAGLYSQVK